MPLASEIGLGIAALGTAGILDAVEMAKADDVPDALSVEWQGKKPCEKLFDDAQVRVVRCTFPPGAVHVCHSHPGYLSYVVNGGQGQVQDEKGIRKIDVVSGALLDVPPTPWHEFANVGNTAIQFVVVEKKIPGCPPSESGRMPEGSNRARSITAGRDQACRKAPQFSAHLFRETDMDISQAFADLNSKFVETVNSHDAHRWAALFSEDAVLVPAGQPSVSGRNRIEDWGESS